MGINTSHKGLSVRLLRSASLLGLLHLYRFIFVVGVLQVEHCPANIAAVIGGNPKPCQIGKRIHKLIPAVVDLVLRSQACQGHMQSVICRVSWRGMSGIPRSSA